MKKINKEKNRTALLVLFIFFILVFSSFFTLYSLIDEKEIKEKDSYKKTITPDVAHDHILEEFTTYCSEDINKNQFFSTNISKKYGCFPKDTPIYMPDGKIKKIENINIGNKIVSYDLKTNDFVTSTVVSKFSHKCEGIFSINEGTLLTTADHPVIVKKPNREIVWASFNPIRSNHVYDKQVELVEVGDKLFSYENGWVEIKKIDYKQETVEVFSLEVDSNLHNFFADTFLVSNNNFYVLKGYKEGIDYFYKQGYTVYNLSKIQRLTDPDEMSYEELREKFDVSLKYDFRIIINIAGGNTYTSATNPTIYESDVSAVGSKNILVRDGDNFYYGWLRIEIFVN